MSDRKFLTRTPTAALEIAALVKLLPMQEAADLIEQYARTVAAGAKIDATQEAHAKFDNLMRRAIETPLSKVPA